MMKTEFEKIAGYEVSFDDYYNIIEPMYMATNLNKQEFVKTLNKARFALKTKAELLNEIKKLAKQLKKTCDHYTDYETQEKLYALVAEMKERFGNYYEVSEITTPGGCSYPAILRVFSGYSLSYMEVVHLTK